MSSLKILVGIDGIARNIKSAYVGVDNKARSIVKIYVGDSNNKARVAYLRPASITLSPGSNQTITVKTNRSTYTKSFTAFYDDTWNASVSPNTGYNAGSLNSTSGTFKKNTTISASDASLKYFTLSCGSTTYQTYSVSFTANPSYGGVLPSNVSGQSGSKDFSCPYGATATVSYALLSNDAQYTYSGATSTRTYTMTSAQACASASATRTINQYTVTLTGSYANKNVRVTNSSGATISSGSKYNYGTVIYINGSLPSTTAQYSYSGLSLKWGGSSVSAGSTQTLTGDITIDISCTRTLRSYTVTISPGSNQTITVRTNRGTYTSSFTAYYGDTWTASISASSGYNAGSLSGTSGTITGNTTISATAATASSTAFTITAIYAPTLIGSDYICGYVYLAAIDNSIGSCTNSSLSCVATFSASGSVATRIAPRDPTAWSGKSGNYSVTISGKGTYTFSMTHDDEYGYHLVYNSAIFGSNGGTFNVTVNGLAF